MPLGPYKDFGECVREQRRRGLREENARRYCGAIKRDVEGSIGDRQILLVKANDEPLSRPRLPWYAVHYDYLFKSDLRSLGFEIIGNRRAVGDGRLYPVAARFVGDNSLESRVRDIAESYDDTIGPITVIALGPDADPGDGGDGGDDGPTPLRPAGSPGRAIEQPRQLAAAFGSKKHNALANRYKRDAWCSSGVVTARGIVRLLLSLKREGIIAPHSIKIHSPTLVTYVSDEEFGTEVQLEDEGNGFWVETLDPMWPGEHAQRNTFRTLGELRSLIMAGSGPYLEERPSAGDDPDSNAARAALDPDFWYHDFPTLLDALEFKEKLAASGPTGAQVAHKLQLRKRRMRLIARDLTHAELTYVKRFWDERYGVWERHLPPHDEVL